MIAAASNQGASACCKENALLMKHSQDCVVTALLGNAYPAEMQVWYALWWPNGITLSQDVQSVGTVITRSRNTHSGQ